MSCREFLRRLEALGDDRDAPQGPLESHAAACPRCRRLLAAERAAAAGLRSLRAGLSSVEPPPGFVQRVRLHAQSRPASAPRWPLLAGVALAAGVLGAGMLAVSPRPARAPLATHVMTVGSPEATPVVWSDGAVDIVAPREPAPARATDDRVARLVEWNL